MTAQAADHAPPPELRWRPSRPNGLKLAQAAFIVGVPFAAVSAYWGAGGTSLLDTLGGSLERKARAGGAKCGVRPPHRTTDVSRRATRQTLRGRQGGLGDAVGALRWSGLAAPRLSLGSTFNGSIDSVSGRATARFELRTTSPAAVEVRGASLGDGRLTVSSVLLDGRAVGGAGQCLAGGDKRRW